MKDLDRSVKFFTKVGFTFDPEFTDKNATCMIIGKDIYAMLLVEKFFKTFTKKRMVNATKNIEVMNALSVASRKEVDEVMSRALKAGGTEPRPPEDHGWMYGRDFTDPDGHVWEVFHMDLDAMRKAQRSMVKMK